MKFTLNLQLRIEGIKSCRKALICAIAYGTRIHPLVVSLVAMTDQRGIIKIL
jgi:hypothetical protein